MARTTTRRRGRRTTRNGAALAVPFLIAGLLGAPAALGGFERPRDCRAGKTLFREGAVRIFEIEGTDAEFGEQVWRRYVCSARIRRPFRFYETGPGEDEQFSTFRRSGRRVAFLSTFWGAESFSQSLGWVDLRTGRRRLANIRKRDEGYTVLEVAADERGGIAYLQDTFDDGAQRIGYAGVRPDGRLAVPRPRTRVVDARVVPSSLAVSDGLITWTTRSGGTGAVPTTPAPQRNP